MAEEPAFEIEYAGLYHIKIFASGRVEGFGAGRMTVINRIPQIVAKAVEEEKDAQAREAAGASL